MAKKILNEQFRRMQKLAGIITEEQYMNEAAGIEQFDDYVSDMFNMSVPEDAEEGEYFEDVWEKEQYGDEEEYDTEEWYGLTDYLKSVGGKATLEGNPNINLELMPNGDIKFGATVTLDESLNENVASEMVKFVSQNFDTIKANFIESELEMLGDIEAEEEDYANLNSQMDVSSAEELIDAINERTLGVDLEDDKDMSKLFNMIKKLAQ